MLAISISDHSLEVIKISRSLLRGFFVSSFSRREFPQGLREDKLTEVLKEILPALPAGRPPDQKCVLALPESKVFAYRFKVPHDVSSEALKASILAKAKELISGNIEDLVYNYKVIASYSSEGTKASQRDTSEVARLSAEASAKAERDSSDGGGIGERSSTEANVNQVLFLATRRETLDKYLTIFKSLNLQPIFATSFSQASFETFRQTIAKGETVMFADIGMKTGKLSFFDQLGPVLTIKKKVAPKDLKEEIKKARRLFLEKQREEVKRMILADVKGYFRKERALAKALGIWTIDLNKILEERIKGSRIRYNFGHLPLVSFAKTIGLNLLVERRDSLNLLKPKRGNRQNVIAKFPSTSLRTGIARLNKRATQIAKWLKTRRVKLLLIFGGVWLISVGAILVFRDSLKKMIPSTKQAIPSPAIQPSPIPALKREDLGIQVLNGSGERGVAATTAKFLKDKGYKEIKIGDADRFDYGETLISIKEEKQNYLNLITEDLEDEYTLATAAAWLDKSEEFDVIIIVGRE